MNIMIDKKIANSSHKNSQDAPGRTNYTDLDIIYGLLLDWGFTADEVDELIRIRLYSMKLMDILITTVTISAILVFLLVIKWALGL